MEQLLDTVIQGILTVASALITAGVAYAVAFIKQKVDMIKNQKTQELLNKSIDNVKDLTKKAVNNMYETVSKEMKKNVADGKVDKSELLALKDKVVNEVHGSLTEETKATLSKVTTDLDSYIGYLIEEALTKIKKQEII